MIGVVKVFGNELAEILEVAQTIRQERLFVEVLMAWSNAPMRQTVGAPWSSF